MKAWQVARDWSIEGMELADLPEPTPGPGHVAVRMRAASLNYRDLLTVQGKGGVTRLPLIPFSDGAGEVIAVGDGVTRVAVGDRVCPMFFQSWIDGKVSAASRRYALGGTRPGVLQEVMVLDAEGVSRIPSHLSFQEAATLPCAGLTAWRALFEEAQAATRRYRAGAGHRRRLDLRAAIREARRRERDRDVVERREARTRQGARRRPHHQLSLGPRMGQGGCGVDRWRRRPRRRGRRQGHVSRSRSRRRGSAAPSS